MPAARTLIPLLAIVLSIDAFSADRGSAQQTVGLFLDDTTRADGGYTLFAPLRSTTSYLIDHAGREVHSWPNTWMPGQSVRLLEDGRLLRTAFVQNGSFSTGGAGGRVQNIDWDGAVDWDYEYSSTVLLQHHDVEPLPNGNVLLIAWEKKTQPTAIAAGRDPINVTASGLWPDHIVEVEPSGATGGAIVWEWHVWDHLIQDYDSSKPDYGDPSDYPERIDLNFVRAASPTNPDWTHVNSIDYEPALDQILVSAHGFNEVWVIDHGTTTAEASGHTGGAYGRGGDLLYRWGNPRAYGRGTMAAQRLYGEHDAQWILPGLSGAGHLLVFNNGAGRGWSSVDEIASPVDSAGEYFLAPGAAFGPTAATWTYSAPIPTDFYAQNISGAQRLSNGNTLVCDGPHGIFFEITSGGETVWKYVNPVVVSGPLNQGDSIPSGPQGQENTAFRSYRYAAEFAGFVGRDLTPGGPIELYPETAVADPSEGDGLLLAIDRNPLGIAPRVRFMLPRASSVSLTVFDLSGRSVRTLADGPLDAGPHAVGFDPAGLSSGVYFMRLDAAGRSATLKAILLR